MKHALHPGTRLTALIVASATFMGQLDTSVVLVALPQMARAFGVRPVALSIGITIYILAQAVTLPGTGWVADRFGARRVFAWALAGFTLASVLCGACHTLPQFITARVLQGVAAALMTPVARLVLLQVTPKEDLVQAMTITTVPMLVAPTLGPPIGGLIVTYLSWPWIFLLNVPVGIAGVVLVLKFIPRLPAAPRRPFDHAGFALLAAATAGILFGLEELSESVVPWGVGAGFLLAGAVCGLAALRHMRRHEHPLVALSPLSRRTFMECTFVGGTIVRLPVRALPFVLPLLFQVVLGFSALRAGLLLLATNGGDLLLKSMTTRSLRRWGFRTVLLASTAVMMAAMALCALLAGPRTYWLLFALLAVSGAARSLLFTGISTLAFADISPQELSSASVWWNLGVQMTGALGVSLAAILLNLAARLLHQPPGHLTLEGCQAVLLAMTAAGLAALPTFARLPRDTGAALSGHEVDRGGADEALE